MLRKGVGSERAKANLKRAKKIDRGRGAKLTAKSVNRNCARPSRCVARHALPRVGRATRRLAW